MRDFGRAELLEPEAIGQPGQRTFRLRVKSGSESASLWLEKEQLAALTLAIRQLLEQTPSEGADTEDEPSGGGFPEPAQVEFKIGRLGIGYDEANRMVVLFAYSIEDAPDEEEADEESEASPSFACRVSRGQCATFADQAETVISAGRPVCVLCGGPIEPDGHRCLRRNGHSQQPISLDE